MSPLGWHPPCLVDNTDTQYPGDHHWHQCWFFRFFSFFVSVCLYMFQLVCVFVCIFTINLKFLKTHNYWLVQLVYVSLDSGLELKKWKLCIKTFRKFPKKSWGGGGGGFVLGFGSKQPLQQQSTPAACFIGPVWSMVVLWNVCFLSAKSFLFSYLAVNNCIEILFRLFYIFPCD